MQEECVWCQDGFMNSKQFIRWKKFRNNMRQVSGTYTLLQSIIEDLIVRLTGTGNREAMEIKIKGKKLLATWKNAESSEDRNEASKELHGFHKKAMEFLAGPNRKI